MYFGTLIHLFTQNKKEINCLTTYYHFSPKLREKTIKILSIRVKKSVSLETSVLFTIKLPANDVDVENIKWIGWEPNEQGKYLPRCASLASSMDPKM